MSHILVRTNRPPVSSASIRQLWAHYAVLLHGRQERYWGGEYLVTFGVSGVRTPLSTSVGLVPDPAEIAEFLYVSLQDARKGQGPFRFVCVGELPFTAAGNVDLEKLFHSLDTYGAWVSEDFLRSRAGILEGVARVRSVFPPKSIPMKLLVARAVENLPETLA